MGSVFDRFILLEGIGRSDRRVHGAEGATRTRRAGRTVGWMGPKVKKANSGASGSKAGRAQRRCPGAA